MQRIFLTSDNLSEINENGGAKYFIIESDVLLKADVKFAKGSVFEFRGGSFGIDTKKVSHANINLNESQVEALAYCIFPRTVTVSNFSNDLVHAEWFNDTQAGEGEEVFINRALVAANGCPVTLENREYKLKGSITFPELFKYQSQSLCAPGTLCLMDGITDTAIIRVNAHCINLDINCISGNTTYNTKSNTKSGISGGIVRSPEVAVPSHGNSGIRFVGDNSHCNVKVQIIQKVNKALDFSPIALRKETTDGKQPVSTGVQYCRVEFQHIMYCKYGIYVDSYTYDYKGESNKVVTSSGKVKYSQYNWCNENYIFGGKLEAEIGINFEVKPSDFTGSKGSADGWVFDNIGLEGIKTTAMRLCSLEMCNFTNIRMMESLPETTPWIELHDAFFTNISIKGHVDPTRIKIDENSECRGVIFNGWVMDDHDGIHPWFNRMAVMPYGATGDNENGNELQKVALTAYSSIVPFNMAKTLEANSSSTGSEYVETSFGIKDMLPVLTNHNPDNLVDFTHSVRPSTLNVSVGKMNIMKLDLRGLRDFGPAFVDINATIEESGKLLIQSDLYAYWGDTSNDYVKYTLTRSGLYRLLWNTDWNLTVTEIITKDA